MEIVPPQFVDLVLALGLSVLIFTFCISLCSGVSGCPGFQHSLDALNEPRWRDGWVVYFDLRILSCFLQAIDVVEVLGRYDRVAD